MSFVIDWLGGQPASNVRAVLIRAEDAARPNDDVLHVDLNINTQEDAEVRQALDTLCDLLVRRAEEQLREAVERR